MRLLQVINTLEPAGAEVLLRDITIGLARRGLETAVYLLRSTGGPLERALAEAGIPTYRSPVRSVRSPRQAVALARHLRAQTYDVVHVHLFPAQLWAALAARLAATPACLVTTEHNTHTRRRRPLFKGLDSWMYGCYAHVVCVSRSVAESLARWIPATGPRLSVIPNGVDIDRFAPAEPARRDQIPGIAGPIIMPIIMMVGRFDPQKDQRTLLWALRQVDGAHLVLVGDGATRVEVERLATRLGLAERTHLVGTREDVRHLLKLADIYVQSSNWEGFSLAALEAMASGIPVVGSRIPGLTDVLDGAAVFFEPGDADGLARSLNALLHDPTQRAELARRGRARAEQFRIETTIDHHERLYRQICGARGAPRIARSPTDPERCAG